MSIFRVIANGPLLSSSKLLINGHPCVKEENPLLLQDINYHYRHVETLRSFWRLSMVTLTIFILMKTKVGTKSLSVLIG